MSASFESIISGTDLPTDYPAAVLVNVDDPTDRARAIGYRIDPDGSVAGLVESPAEYSAEFVNTVVLGWVASDWGTDPITTLGHIAAVPSGVDGVTLLVFGHAGAEDGSAELNPAGDAVVSALVPADGVVPGQVIHGSVYVLTGGERTGESTTAPFVPVPQSIADTIAQVTGADVTVPAGQGGTRDVDTDAGFSLATMLGLTPFTTSETVPEPEPQTIADVLAMLGITDGAVDASDLDDTDDDTDDDDGFSAFLSELFGAEGPALGEDVYPDMIEGDGPFVPEVTEDDDDPFGVLDDDPFGLLTDDDAPVVVWSTDAEHPGTGDDRE